MSHRIFKYLYMKIYFYGLLLFGCFILNHKHCLTVKHSLTYLITTSSGLQSFPDFILVGMVDGVQVGYCDSINKTAEPSQPWVNKMNEDNPQNLQLRTQNCKVHYQLSKADIESINQHFNQTEGMSTLL